MSAKTPNMRSVLRGVMPPIAMPFDKKGQFVKTGMREQIDLIIKAGASGIVAGGSTGEGHTLSDAEFVAAMTDAYEANAGRVPFLAGLIVNSTIQAIDRIRMLDGMKITALQVTPVHYQFKPDEKATTDAVGERGRHFRHSWMRETGETVKRHPAAAHGRPRCRTTATSICSIRAISVD